MFSTHACWQQLIQQTKSLARDHATLSDIYSTQLVHRLQTVYDDCQRIYKRCREVGYEIHEEILRVLQELHTTMKTYHGYQLECREAEKKLRAAEVQRAKIQQVRDTQTQSTAVATAIKINFLFAFAEHTKRETRTQQEIQSD
jgi:SLIT-ROBO Rho GTPase activating protein